MTQGGKRNLQSLSVQPPMALPIQAFWHELANFTGFLNGKEFTNQMFFGAPELNMVL